MLIPQPSSTVCYDLKLPNLPANFKTLDEAKKRSLTLDCRTGAAISIARSNIFVHGGLVLPLNLTEVSLVNVQQEIIMYFAKEKGVGSSFKNLIDWVSSEVFFLDLISRTWQRVPTTMKENTENNRDQLTEGSLVTNRLFHSMCYTSSHLYIFGGLAVYPESGYELIATNSLWQLDLVTKEWSLISEDPQIPRRFSHSMHVKNENDESKDTKIVIVGGLSNLDEPLQVVNIFNITKNCWELEIDPLYKDHISLNIEGKRASMVTKSNFSILVENNKADVPALICYYPQIKETLNRDSTNFTNASNTQLPKDRYSHTVGNVSPLAALPLLPDSKGIVMDIDPTQYRYVLNNIFDLRYPTGEYYGYEIILAGYYLDTDDVSFQCYSYDIRSGKWSRINLSCNHCRQSKAFHRFWKLFVWKSHHKILLMGSKVNDGYLPTIQKFDHLMTLEIPTANIQKKEVAKFSHFNKSLVSPISFNFKDEHLIPTISNTDGPLATGKQSYSSSVTSKFESYIRYIAPTEMESVSSVFQSYAMVLGKDAMELFGSPLSDFEFISDEGEAIGVPIYLLRKRWGRYFDMLLAKGYSKVCQDYEATGIQSALIKFTPSQSFSGSKLNRHPSNVSSEGFLDIKARLASMTSLEKFTEDSNYPKLRRSSSASIDSDHHIISGLNNNIIPETTEPLDFSNTLSRGSLNSRSRSSQVDIASTSTGMVFRVPFQDRSKTGTTVFSDLKVPNERRASLNSLPTLEMLKKDVRRLSHPKMTTLTQDHSVLSRGTPADIIHSRRTSVNSARNLLPIHSRKGSLASQASLMSYLSSNSDMMAPLSSSRRDSINTLDSQNSGLLNVPLPPQCLAPTELLPPVPKTNTRKSSILINDISSTSAPSSPLMSKLNIQSDNIPHLSQLRKSSSSSALGDNCSSASSNNYKDKRRGFGSWSSTASNRNVEFEPLLTPRALYLPWSTATLQAFAEFFYTGQVNLRWQLVPVVLNLLIMAKLYEVPLLSSLITEALYTVVSRKEENLHLITRSLLEATTKEARKEAGKNEEALHKILQNNPRYLELMKLKDSLDNIENGYFDMPLQSMSGKLSISTTASDESDRYRRSSSLASYKSNPNNAMYRDILKNGSGSVTSAGSGPVTTLKTPLNKKSSNLRKSEDFGDYKFATQETVDQDKLRVLSSIDMDDDSDSASSEEKLSYIDKLRKLSVAYRRKSMDGTSNINLLDNLDASSSSQSDLDDSDFELGIFSLNTIKKKLSERYADESIDPLMDGTSVSSECLNPTIGSNDPLSNRTSGNISIDPRSSKSSAANSSQAFLNKIIYNRCALKDSVPGIGSQSPPMGNSNGNISQPYMSQMPTLENIMVPNSLPPISYIIKSIYRTAILTNDVRLMIRCLDCLEISEALKKIKRKMNAAQNNANKNAIKSNSKSSIKNIKGKNSASTGQINESSKNKNTSTTSHSSTPPLSTKSTDSINISRSESPGPKPRTSKSGSKNMAPRYSSFNFLMSPSVANSQSGDSLAFDKQQLSAISPRTSVAADTSIKESIANSHSKPKRNSNGNNNTATNTSSTLNQSSTNTPSNNNITGSLFFFGKKK
ncbi:hypothetical protein TPHA_0D01060 [Tetrapisispora phaffii CBS 4417]|uniref:BTB domain-containing protein n=1 Tax=Tetrapisispora phaffii (strain ATCC 24235 / CBS 4417 / NBRC 1672 / NRRL Y-8282 / UCD 70-5) TaxID=1071381 RepID=G8BSC6_TETPH|nr:hypothetical protein TPHA_0D01060 [Tetrapisispora phaffii CBS 4417]CCE62747.1 hypothetical protein TPHA_0D01060 [Tetrapisispora phaffii CBS 4417]